MNEARKRIDRAITAYEKAVSGANETLVSELSEALVAEEHYYFSLPERKHYRAEGNMSARIVNECYTLIAEIQSTEYFAELAPLKKLIEAGEDVE